MLKFKFKFVFLSKSPVGKLCEENRGILSVTYPMNHGLVEDWDGMHHLWGHLFSSPELDCKAEDHPVFKIFLF